MLRGGSKWDFLIARRSGKFVEKLENFLKIEFSRSRKLDFEKVLQFFDEFSRDWSLGTSVRCRATNRNLSCCEADRSACWVLLALWSVSERTIGALVAARWIEVGFFDRSALWKFRRKIRGFSQNRVFRIPKTRF